MTLSWHKQDAPRWDEAKRELFGPDGAQSTGLVPPADGEPLADEWFALSDDGGVIVGYGWLDCEWGDAQVTFLVAPGRRGSGLGGVILDHLEREAARRGVNYIYNVVPDTHPDPQWMTRWLVAHGFHRGTGDLRRRVRPS